MQLEGMKQPKSSQGIQSKSPWISIIREEMEEGARPKTFLVITEKGKRMTEKLMVIQDILEGQKS